MLHRHVYIVAQNPDIIPILFLFVKYSYGICLFRLRTDQEQCIVSSIWIKMEKTCHPKLTHLLENVQKLKHEAKTFGFGHLFSPD